MPLFVGEGGADWPYHAFIVSTGLLSLCAQVFLFWMIVTKSPKPMHNFRLPLCMLTFWDFVLTFIIAVMVDPEMIFPQSGAIVTGVGQYVGKNGGVILFCLALYSGAGIIANQDYCLMYRFVCIQQRFPGLMRKFTSVPALIGFQILGHSICACVAAGGYLALVMPDAFAALLVKEGGVERWCGSDCDNITLRAVHDALENGLPLIVLSRQSSKAISVLIGVGFVVSELLSFGLALIIFRTLRANVSCFSPKTYRMHVQMTTLIVLQICTPIVFIVFPVTVAAFCFFFTDHMSRQAGEWGIVLIALDAPVSTFVTIFFVTPFRRYTLERFGVNHLLVKCGVSKPLQKASTNNNNNIQLENNFRLAEMVAANTSRGRRQLQSGHHRAVVENRERSGVSTMARNSMPTGFI